MLERALVLPGGQSNIKLIRAAKALSCKRSEESHRELMVWPTQELGHPLFLTYGSSEEGQPSMRFVLLPTSTDVCAASQHGRSVTGFDLCCLASPVGHLSGCSLFLFSVPCERLIMPQPGRQSSSVSAIHPLLPCAFGEAAGCQPVSLQPSWEIRLHSGESHGDMAFVFLCYSLAIIFNHDFFPASPRTFGFANLTPSSY